MPKKAIKIKSKPKPKTTNKNTNKNTNINNVHVHVEKPKTRKKRTTKPKTNIANPSPIATGSSLSQSVSQRISHQRGLINNEIQQPTIIQQIQSLPDPRLDKLEKRTKKIKEQLKENKSNTSPQTTQPFQDAYETPLIPQKANIRLKPENMTPKILSFDEVTKPKGFFSKLFSSKKKKMPETEMSKREQDPFKDAIEPQRLLEYKPESIYMSEQPSATAPNYIEEANGIKITKELKNLVNQLHAAHPNSKLHISTFRSAISKRLRELGVAQSHTNAYVKQMRDFYDEIYKNDHDVVPI